MNISRIIPAVAILGLIALLFAGLYFSSTSLVRDVAGVEEEGESTALTRGAAPYFDLPNLAGDHVRLSDFIDMPLVVVFWATWDVAAADEIKILDDYLASGSEDSRLVKVLAINSQEERSIVASFVRRGGYVVPVLLDTRGAIAEEYGVKAMPAIFFIDRNGDILETYSGVLSERMIGDKVGNLLLSSVQ